MKWGSTGTGDGQFVSPVDVAVDEQGNVYVVDDSRNDVQKFDPTGQFLLKWGSSGSDDGQFAFVGGLSVDPRGNVYVADFANHRVQKFDSNGRFLAKWGHKGAGDDELDDPCDVALDAEGNVYVTNFVEHNDTPPRVQKFDSSGRYVARWGSQGRGDGQFAHPCGIAVDKDGNAYIADIANNTVQKFRPR